MDIAAPLEEKKNESREITARHGARTVRVLRSVARGEARPARDVDFLVDLAPHTLLDLGGLSMELRDLLGMDVDVVTVHGLNRVFVSASQKEAESL
jgi:predicted nucleotidyltransferase